MENSRKTYNLSVITKKILESGFILFNGKTLRDISEIKNKASFSTIINRLLSNKILLRLEKDKYLVKNKVANPDNLANLLYSPSYISFETALNFYGILSQFPHELSSATPKKTAIKKIMGQLYSYTHLNAKLFFGFVKHDGVLIASPEKALLDQIYLAQKGWKKINLEEYDFSIIKKGRLKEYYAHYPKNKQTQKMRIIIDKILTLC
jgi:predicted transcriptional regulator of viral defense system